MFSGIIKEKGTVKFINNGILSIAAEITGKNAYIGQSIAVNGLCLTVRKINYPVLFFNFTPETYRSSALRYLRISEKVNVEPALSVGSDISGHFVLGHIDGIGRIVVKKRIGNSIIMGIKIVDSIDGDIGKYIINKGSISVDGISLTVNEIKGDIFFVSVIPLTYDETNLKFKATYDYVNLESDIIEKTVAIRMSDKTILNKNKREGIQGSLTYEFLAKNGFK